MNPLVRVAQPEDADVIAEVHVEARNAYYRGLVPEEDLDHRATELRRIYKTLIGRSDDTLLCAQKDNNVVGMTLFGRPHDTHFDPTTVGEMYQLHVRPDHWRQGIGSQLHRACLQAWRDSGVSTGVLEVWDRNDRARAFYTRHGWQADGHSRPGHGNTSYLRLRNTLGL
jgi:ribosomal protein S18 acetylase RimI-like enzyme